MMNHSELAAATRTAAEVFQKVSGLRELEQKVTAHYCASTYFINVINPFSSLVLMGPAGTGKTSILRACNLLCHKPVFFSASKITSPVLRDNLGKAHTGTAIIDEADEADCDLEGFLTLRYLRETAISAKKVPVGDKEWVTENIPIYGASILHKRISFKDFAVEARSIVIKTTPDTSKTYSQPEELDALINIFKNCMAKVRGLQLNKKINIPRGVEVAPRVVDTYKPVLLQAQELEEDAFLQHIWTKIEDDSLSLKDGQAYEPGPLLLQALVNKCTHSDKATGKDTLGLKNPVRVEGCLLDWIYQNHGKRINAWQAARILRGYGFEVKRSGGINRVLPDVAILIRSCRAAGTTDEVVENEAKKLGL